jgi:AmmeMemoRadiSam system protein A
MGPSPSPEPVALTETEQRALVDAARTAVRHGLEGDLAWAPRPADLTPRVLDLGATFVTLRRHGNLLGCIGTLQPSRPLVDDVVANARGAAYADPRLPAVTEADFPDMTVKISVLGPIEPLDIQSVDDLATTVRPGVDGLLVTAGSRRATFLPSVWEMVPEVDMFLRMLWEKAGLRAGSWPRRTTVARYSTVEFGT